MTARDAPTYLSAALKERFAALYNAMGGQGYLCSADADLLAKYVVAEDAYLMATRRMQEALAIGDPELTAKWLGAQDKLVIQVLRLGGELGLTPSARRALGIIARK